MKTLEKICGTVKNGLVVLGTVTVLSFGGYRLGVNLFGSAYAVEGCVETVESRVSTVGDGISEWPEIYTEYKLKNKEEVLIGYGS